MVKSFTDERIVCLTNRYHSRIRFSNDYASDSRRRSFDSVYGLNERRSVQIRK